MRLDYFYIVEFFFVGGKPFYMYIQEYMNVLRKIWSDWGKRVKYLILVECFPQKVIGTFLHVIWQQQQLLL